MTNILFMLQKKKKRWITHQQLCGGFGAAKIGRIKQPQ